MVTGRTPPTFDLPGYLELLDRPAEATPVEAMMVSLHPLVLDYDVEASSPWRNCFFLSADTYI